MTIEPPKRRRVRRARPEPESAKRLKAAAYAARIAERDQQLAVAGVVFEPAPAPNKPSK